MGPTAAPSQPSRSGDSALLGTSHRLTLLHRQKVVATNKTTQHWCRGGEACKPASAFQILVEKEQAHPAPLPMLTPFGALLGICMELRMADLMAGPEFLYLMSRNRLEVDPSQWQIPAIPVHQGTVLTPQIVPLICP